jgi:hypothetical protein
LAPVHLVQIRPQKVLNENWKEYDKKKHDDEKLFAYRTMGGVDYLVKVIRKA